MAAIMTHESRRLAGILLIVLPNVMSYAKNACRQDL